MTLDITGTQILHYFSPPKNDFYEVNSDTLNCEQTIINQ